ncbi:AAA family ATPase [Acetomicrobium sp.]|uniref:AAA family ATPase n=1 Tax=Acetomicrobium sp. TaxID=1872099 RepID=UPI002FCA2EEB
MLGPRGVGKTTLTLVTRSKEMLYIPADNPLVAPFKLWDICEAAFRAGYDGRYIDELHYAREWAVHLKALYDAFPGKSDLGHRQQQCIA